MLGYRRGSQSANAKLAAEEIRKFLRDTATDAVVELATAGVGGFLGKFDDVSDLRKAAKAKKAKDANFSKPLLVRLENLKEFTQGNFRENFKILTGTDPGPGVQAHHILPQKFAGQLAKKGINVHNPAFGAWWEAGDHARRSRQYEDLFGAFLDANPGASKPAILNEARDLAERFGLDFIF